MYKLIKPVLILIALFVLGSHAFAVEELHCRFTDRQIKDIESIVIKHDQLVINNKIKINLDLSEINCSTFGRQLRFDGNDHGYQVILKTCTSEAVLEGRIIDVIKQEIGDITCDLVQD